MHCRDAAPTIVIVLCLTAKAAGFRSGTPHTPGRALLQSQAGATPDVQIPVAAELQVTCPFFVPFNQASQALITGALQAVLPPNSTFTAVTMTQQLNSDTVIVDAQFQLRESQLAVLVANKCCDLEVLFLQQAVREIDSSAVGQNISMSLIDWRIGNTSMGRAPSGAPTAGPTSPAAAPAPAAAAARMPGPAPAPATPGPPLPSGQASRLDYSTPFFLGGVTAESSAVQADANITVVDVPVRAICLAPSNSTFGATLDLAIAHRYAVKTLMWPLGFEVEVLNMSDSSNSTSLVSVDFLNRLWVNNQAASDRVFRLKMLQLAATAPMQYVGLMRQSGFDVQVVVLNTSVAGTMVNSSLPSITVVPPTDGQNVTWSAILMTLQIQAPGLLPFTDAKQRLLTGVVVQVLQQYGAAFVHIQSYNATQSPVGSRKLQRKLLNGAGDIPGMGSHQGRGLAQTGASLGGGMLQVDMIVTVPAEQQLQVLSLGTTDETSQSLAASGFPATVTLAAASPNAMGGPFSANYPASRPPPAVAEGVTPSRGGGMSKGRKDTAIAVPIILGGLIAAVVAGLLLLRRRRRSSTKGRALAKEAPVAKGTSGGQAGGPIMDTARIQSTGGTDIPLSAGDMYDTDMDDKMGLTRSPAKPPLQDDGLDIQATQAGAVRRVLGRMHAREQEVSNALAETATFVMHHLQAGSVFRDRYSLTGWRWRSPNAIWCGADQVDEPWGPVALKMYALTSDFIREKELLDMPYSSEHWPTVFDTYTYSDVGFEGDACPPCIVMQPPVATLQTWMDAQNRSNLVWEEQVATLYNLCKALQSFHARGMVHCSLAPPSFSWFQGGQGWKVAACGDWAQAGMHVRSCYQLRYASPEAVQGDLFDVAGAAADPAMDMWALGAIAFEIFTAQGLFSRKSYTDNDVINMLLGFDRLPSESQPAFWRQIRDTAAQRLVQNLLRRVPEQRSTINEVLASPIFNSFTQTSKASKRGSHRSLWSQDFVDKLTTTASSLRSMDTRMSDELQPRQASALLDAQDRNGAHTASDESLTSKELQEIGSFNSAGSVDQKDLYRLRTQNS